MSSSTFPHSIIAFQVKGGTMDIHTSPRYVVTTTVAATPARPFTTTLRGMPASSAAAAVRISRVPLTDAAHDLLVSA